MKTTNIKEFLSDIDVDYRSICLGDFDSIGELTAKRERDKNSHLYHNVGRYYRASYERGILIYYLIKQFKISSMLEIGFGRGYSSLCAAKAFVDCGIDGKILTIDPNIDEKYIQALGNVFPKEWLNKIRFAKGTSQQVLPTIEEKFDLVYVDGDHSYEGTKFDIDHTKNLCSNFMLLDDYHLPSKDDPGIKCREAIDEFHNNPDSDFSPGTLILMDRLIFIDDRGKSDLDYGQVLFCRPAQSLALPTETRDDWDE